MGKLGKEESGRGKWERENGEESGRGGWQREVGEGKWRGVGLREVGEGEVEKGIGGVEERRGEEVCGESLRMRSKGGHAAHHHHHRFDLRYKKLHI